MRVGTAILVAAVAPDVVGAQHAGHGARAVAPGDSTPRDSDRSRASWRWGAQVTALATRAWPVLAGAPLTEGYLSQPHLTGGVTLLRGRVDATGTLNFEGLTLRRGELNPGMFGEGYVDRRHPHTYVHDVVASLRWPVPGGAASLAVGRGFTPFGTEDPMDRPFAKFPVNHHQAQVMERLLGVGALRWRAALVEVGTFNGDEPSGPGRAPRLSRFGDSWAARLTGFPAPGLEISGSHASVKSPEVPAGWFFDQRKWSASARWARESRLGATYALAEWAMTDELAGGRRAYRFSTLLAEGAHTGGVLGVAARVERTTRPEEQRLVDPFRSMRPPHDFGVLGITRWEIATVAVRAPGVARALARWLPAGIEPFGEVARLRATPLTRPTVFEPRAFYGSDRIWTVSAGTRLHVGAGHQRVGQYGAAVRASSDGAHSGHR